VNLWPTAFVILLAVGGVMILAGPRYTGEALPWQAPAMFLFLLLAWGAFLLASGVRT
jgi:hypothetical protein